MYDYGYNYGYDSYDVGSAVSTVGIFAGVGIFMWIIGMAVAIFSVICMWKLFTKAGKKGWAAIVPIYNIIVMLEIAELPMWYIALFLVPFANVYAMFKIYIEIAHKFGKSTGFGVGMVFLGVIFIPMLALGKAEYKGGISVPVNSSVNEGFNIQNNNMQVNQPMMNNNVPNMNSQPDIMNVNGNVGTAPMMDVNMSNNGSTFQPIGDINNNINGMTSINSYEQPATNVQEVNTASNNVVESVNSNVVNPINVETTPVAPAIPDTLGDVVVPMNNVIEPVNSNVVNPINVETIPAIPVAPNNLGNVDVPMNNVLEPMNSNVVNPINDMKKTCPNCGNQVDFNALFCTNCGNNL